MSLDRKLEALFGLGGDLIAIQECSDNSIQKICLDPAWTGHWVGANPRKGLGLIVRRPWKITEVAALPMQLAFRARVEGPINLDIFPVWTQKGSHREERYIRQVHKLIEKLTPSDRKTHRVVLGDFNSNSIWDRHYQGRGHSWAVKQLNEVGLQSAYHLFYGEEQGLETRPTFFFRKKKAAPFHIDYAFLGSELLKTLCACEVGRAEDWLSLSDHMPLVLEFDMNEIEKSD